MTWPEGLFRVAVACEVLAIVLVLISLFWNAPLESLADPMQTPNPAKAPWYFLGLQELLHYFPPVVGGVLIPTLVVIALIVIPYFNVNVEAEGVWYRNRRNRLQVFSVVSLALIALLLVFEVWAVLAPTVIDRRGHALRGSGIAARGPRPSLALLASALVLDHDVVPGDRHLAHGDRHVLPRPRMGVGLALERMR